VGGTDYTDSITVATADGTSQVLTVTMHGTNDAPNDIALAITTIPADTNLPSNTIFGQFSVPVGADPDGGGGYSFSLLSLDVSNFTTGASISDATPDLAVSSAGLLSTGNGQSAMQTNRVYQLDVQVEQGSKTYHETFSIITGTNQNDVVDGAITNGDDVIYGLQNSGSNSSDVIFAGSGNDTVFGQAGNDKIYGGDGNDTLYGGGGNDYFVFDTPLNASTNVDLIADFNAGTERISLSNAAGNFDQLTAASPTGQIAASAFDVIGVGPDATADTRIVYDPTTGALYYDADGTGSGAAAIQFATLGTTTHPTLTYLNFLVGDPPPTP
jgi:Ca2+-binding RTX toxin-like protein